MTDLLDKFVTEVAARTADDGTVTKDDLRAAFTAATGEPVPRDLHAADDADLDALADQWSAESVPEAAQHPDPHEGEDAAYAQLAAAAGINDPASLRRQP